MGGRGSSSAGGLGGGGKADTPRIKTDIGGKRDEIKSSVRSALKGKTFNKNAQDENGKKIDIRISGIDSKHITNDIFQYKTIEINEIKNLSNQFTKSSFIKTSPLKHIRKDSIDRFFYFKAIGKDLYFNVGRYTNKKGNVYYKIYSITKSI